MSKSDTEKTPVEGDYKYVIMVFGKTGSGVSSTVNTLVGRNACAVGSGLHSKTQEIQSETMKEEMIQVIDMPDLVSMDHEYNSDWKSREVLLGWRRVPLDAALLVIRADDRYTPGQYEIYMKMREKLGDIITPDNLIVVFTHGKLFQEEYVQHASGELQCFLQDARHQYSVMENSASDDDKEMDVCRLLTMVDRLQDHSAPDRKPKKIYRFSIDEGPYPNSFSIDEGPRTERSGNLFECWFTTLCRWVMDTPGLMDNRNPRNWAESIIARSLRHSDYKPDVILYVIKASDRIADIDEEVLNCIQKLFGPKCFKYMIVVFTCEDQLVGRSLADCLLEVRDDNRISLSRLLEQVGSRYLTITNSSKLSSRQINEQILELLKMTQKMMVSNNPSYYCPTLPAFDNASTNEENEFCKDIPLPAPRNLCIQS